MNETRANLFKVGIIFAIGLLMLFAATVTFAHLDFLREPHYMKVQFKNVGGLKEGDGVRVSGLELGRVDRLDINPGGVEATLRLHSEIQLREDYVIQVAMSSLVGGRHVAIDAGDPGKQLIDTKATLKGLPPGSPVDEIGEMVKENRKAVREFIENLNEVAGTLKRGEGTLGKLLHDDKLYDEATSALTEVREAVAELKKAGEVITKVGDVVGQVRDQLDSGEGTLAKLLKSDEIYNSLNGSVEKLNGILAKMERGDGTMGKMLNDPALYDEAKSLVTQTKDAIASVQKIVDKIERGEGAGRLLNDDKLAQDIADTVAEAKAITSSLKNIMAQIESGEGMAGKLIFSKKMGDQAEETMDALDKTLGAAGRVKTLVSFGSHYFQETNIFGPWAKLQIYPTEDRYFEVGAVAWPASDRTPWEFPEQLEREEGKVFINATALLGFKWMDGRLDTAIGLLEGKIGARASYRITIPWIEHDVTIAAEVRQAYTDPDELDEHAGKVNTRVYLDTKIWKWFHAQVGVNRLFHDPEIFGGVSFTYEDEDIRTFISLLGLAK
ncbi:MAG: Mammalian cell entry related domain-containing [Planctomycetota bacterium]|nr:MAG: Mammalian cell entry related domain-containing [Planctomycetota bacterium]